MLEYLTSSLPYPSLAGRTLPGSSQDGMYNLWWRWSKSWKCTTIINKYWWTKSIEEESYFIIWSHRQQWRGREIDRWIKNECRKGNCEYRRECHVGIVQKEELGSDVGSRHWHLSTLFCTDCKCKMSVFPTHLNHLDCLEPEIQCGERYHKSIGRRQHPRCEAWVDR